MWYGDATYVPRMNVQVRNYIIENAMEKKEFYFREEQTFYLLMKMIK